MADHNSGNNLHGSNKKQGRWGLFFFLVAMFFFVFFLITTNTAPRGNEMAYTEFVSRVSQGQVDSVRIIDQTRIRGVLRDIRTEDGLFYTFIPYTDPSLMPLLEENRVRVTGGETGVSLWMYILQFAPTLLLLVFVILMIRQSQGQGNRAFQFGKSQARRYEQGNKKITFNDVAGQESQTRIAGSVEFSRIPEFVKMGARIPKGVLLVGMPGTGKTMLARAVAGEADVAFFNISGSDFVEMFVGVGASRVRDLFEQGRKSAPCIIFIDELDAVGRTRGAGYGGGHDEREQTLNQMLVEMDGFDTKDGVIILAATNRPDVLDPACSGRAL